MPPRARSSQRLHLSDIPRRRFTRWAALYFFAFVCLPLLSFCAVVDAALYVIFTRWFDRCYALFCLFQG
ncbi:MAG: hypothetical protein ACFCUQ_18630 [Kiloniellales bacterium]